MDTVNKKQPNYLRIAQKIEQKIIAGQLKNGQKLSSIRQLALQESVSVNTIRSALDTLAQTGIVTSLPRIGFIVSHQTAKNDVQLFEQFAPDSRLAEQSQRWLHTMVLANRANSPFIHMALPLDTKMFKSFQRQFHQIVLQNPKRELDNSAGHLNLRLIISQHLAQRHCQVSESDIQITNGCQHALEHALRVLCQPGDTVAIPVPAFPGYFALLGVLGLKAIEIPMSPLGPDPSILEQVMAQGNIKAVILNPNCHNPTGITLSDAYKKRIALWANRYQVAIVEDDISALLTFQAAAPRLIASYDTNGWCMVVSSISKVIGDSERIGWCCAGRFKTPYITQFAVSQISSSYFLQHALVRYYSGALYKMQLRQWRADIKAAIDQVIQLFTQALPHQVQITVPSGGYALWLKLPDGLTGQQLKSLVNPDEVDFLCGELFSLEPRFKQFIRLIIMPPFSPVRKKSILHLIQCIQQALSLQ